MITAEPLLSVRNRLGEGPLWHPSEQALYWVDIFAGAYSRYDPAAMDIERIEIGLPLGVLRLRKRGGMVAATRDGFQFWDPAERKLTPIASPEAGKAGARFNDGMIDPQGRFWAGTMTEPEGGFESALYRLDPDLSVHRIETGVGTSNGIGWSPDGRTMYYTDSTAKTIYAYDFDPLSGAIANRRDWVTSRDEPGTPDGLTVDSEGFVWSARWGGWKVSRYDPDGKLEREIHVDAEYPTSCVFGGEGLRELYITSAWLRLGEARKEEQPHSGDIFWLPTEFHGLPETYFAG